jgi:hypothetical protein
MRRDLHLKAQVPAVYLRTPDAEPVLVHVRLHEAFGVAGKIAGARVYPAEIENDTPKIRIDLTELPAPVRLAVFSIEAGEAYQIDRLEPVDDQFQTAVVTRLTAAQCVDLPIPDPYA